VKVGGLLCAVVLAAALTACGGGGGFNPDPFFRVGPISDSVSHQILKLDHIASTLAGKRTIVKCWSNRGWARLRAWEGSRHDTPAVDAAGITYPRSRHIELSPVVCQILEQVLERSARQPLFTAWAVHVLAHESAHASGIDAENRAECRAIETDARAAELFGFSMASARRLQHIYRGTLYPHDLPRYRTPPCAAGQPGVVVPDTLGTAANLRPLSHVVTKAARTLLHWRSIGGVLSVGPLSPCSPIPSRSEELARFGEGFSGPDGADVLLSDVTLKTKPDFSAALARISAHPRCSLRLFQTNLRETHSPGRVLLHALPAAVTRLSPQVTGFRISIIHGPIQVNNDLITVVDPARRRFGTVYFQGHAGHVPVSAEVSAVKTMLQSS